MSCESWASSQLSSEDFHESQSQMSCNAETSIQSEVNETYIFSGHRKASQKNIELFSHDKVSKKDNQRQYRFSWGKTKPGKISKVIRC